jgi:hypothetical protein
MPAVKLIRTALFIGTILAAALPAVASAATLTVDKPCYRTLQDAVASGTGFIPNAPVNFTLDGQPFTDPANPPTADAAGNLNAGFGIGSPPGKQKTYVLAASDGTNSAQTTFTATRLDVNVTPKRGNPGKKKRVKARGFDRGKILRYHVRGPRKKNGKVGKVKGPCGKVSKRVRIFKAHFPVGTYTVQFDQKKKYSKRAEPRVVFNVTIFRVFRPRAGASAFGDVGQTWTRLR